jgi:5-formyltetrahydrofolate cyclo-ligase
VTTVHPLQIVPQSFEMLSHDIPVDVVITPEAPMPLTRAYPRPRGLDPDALTPEKIAEVPVLQQLLGRP